MKNHKYHCSLLFVFYFHFPGTFPNFLRRLNLVDDKSRDILGGCNFAYEKFCDTLRERLKSPNLQNIIRAKITQL